MKTGTSATPASLTLSREAAKRVRAASNEGLLTTLYMLTHQLHATTREVERGNLPRSAERSLRFRREAVQAEVLRRMAGDR